MFFQFSPPKEIRKKIKKETVEKTAVLSLAPFTSTPKICFENVQIGNSAVEHLLIKNPTLNKITVNVQVKLDEEIKLVLSWTEKCIDPSEEALLEIVWTPNEAGSWRYMLRFTYCGPPREVPVVLKTAAPKKVYTTTVDQIIKLPLQKKGKTSPPKSKGLPRVVAKKIKSPVSKKRQSPIRRPALPNIVNMPSVVVTSPNRTFNGKENVVPELLSDFLLSSRRETFIVGTSTNDRALDPVFEDSLEKSQTSVLSFEGKLKSDSFVLSSFATPRNEFLPEHCSTDEKSVNTTSSCTELRRFCLFPDPSPTKRSPNVSGDTYVKNLSSETFTKHNLSSETYTKDLSSNTYNIDDTFRDINELATPPNLCKKLRQDSLLGSSVKNAIEANLWLTNEPKRRLIPINEEVGSFEFKPTPVKRKSEDSFAISPKRQNLGVPHVTEWKKQIVSIIDPEFALRLEQHQENFKKWLNAVLAPPSDLESIEQQIDVAKLWRDCLKKDITITPVVLSCSRLNALRKAFKALYKSQEIQGVLTKVWAAIESDRLSIRKDRDVHLDLALQTEVMTVVLSYNPLWLRLGLETIYGMQIPLRSNSDIVGLTTFLKQWFLRNPTLFKKYKSVHLPRYVDAIKKFILKKFFALVLLLDRAKTKKLIGHDPCLFRKNAPFKESREALTRFCRDIITSMGDITKYLKHYNYIVEHKQSYLNEYDYTVNSLGVDLRDGVRLTRVMEVILLQPDLSKDLRVPAISRLQKIHNVTIAFDAIKISGFEIMHEITPTDIVNGHKEKTLAFLWQIIHKMETPLMTKSVTIITRWWRSEHILRKREELRIITRRKTEAAIKIQRWYRKSQSYLKQLEIKRKDTAATKIQSFFRAFVAKRQFQKLKSCVRFIEERYIARKLMVTEKIRFEQLKHAVVIIQRWFRAIQLKNIEEMKYVTLRDSTILIQRKWRAMMAMRKEIQRFEMLKATTIMVQRRFRANLEMKKQQQKYNDLRSKVVFLQTKWRATLVMRDDMFRFQVLKSSTILIQRRFRANLEMKKERESYKKLKETVVFVQRRWRAALKMKKQMKKFHSVKRAAVVIQKRFRAKLAARVASNDYQRLKCAVVRIQRKWRATLAMRKEMKNYENVKKAVIIIQRRYRETKRAELQFESFMRLKSAVIFVQRRFRANLEMKKERESYKKLKETIVFVQRRWRAALKMKKQMKKFQSVKQAAVVIQRRFRAKLVARNTSNDYQRLKSAVVRIQRKWRATLAMRKEMKNYENVKKAVVIIQRRYRETKRAELQFESFLRLKSAVIFVQRRFRANLEMKKERESYRKLKETVVFIQRRWRAALKMKKQIKKFQSVKRAAVVIQKRFRAKLAARVASNDYQRLKSVVVRIQRKWRATLAMRKEMKNYENVKKSVVIIQRRYRETKRAELQFENFLRLKSAAIFVQRKWRAKLEVRDAVEQYSILRKATITIQRRFRETMAAKLAHTNYQKLKQATVLVQRKWRAKLAGRLVAQKFQNLKRAVMVIERRYRETILTRIQRRRFLQLKAATILIQRRWRAKLVMKGEMKKYKALKNACVVIQTRFRATLVAKTESQKFEALKKATIVIQRQWRAKLAMRSETNSFKALKVATMAIQRRFRANKAAKIETQKFEALKKTTIFVQRRWRAKLIMRVEMKKFETLKSAVLVIQRRFRATVIAKIEHEHYKKLRTTIICVQRRWRATLLMKREKARLEDLKRATLVVQRRFRAKLLARIERNKFDILRKTVTYVQRKWRAKIAMRIEMKRYQTLREAALIIQRRFRHIVAIRKEEQRKRDCVAITKVQRYVRGFLIRQKYSDFLTPEAVAARKLLRTQIKAAIVIQRVWRGHKVRNSRTDALWKIYKKLKQANENAVPENTIASRCKNAVIQLNKGNASLKEILSSFTDLDFITRRCQGSLQKLAPVLPPVLYKTITDTNRSMLEVQISTVATLILINFYRFESTRSYVWIPEHVESIITVMLHSCDKESPLFPTLCTLLWFFLRKQEYRRVILNTHKFKEKLTQIIQKVDRKRRMIAKVHVNYVSLFSTNHEEPLPCEKPDWGLDYASRPRSFKNSVQALNCILTVLNV